MATSLEQRDSLSHWSTLIEDFQTSPLAFYEALDAALKRREIPTSQQERVTYREAGLVSANREYLRICRETLVLDICAAPFGTSFFVSWWLVDDRGGLSVLARIGIAFVMAVLTIWLWEKAGLVTWLLVVALTLAGTPVFLDELVRSRTIREGVARSIPLIGTIYVWMFRPNTYYRIDSAEMFQKAAHSAVLEVIDAMTKAKGVRALSDAERKPLLREFYKN